MNSVHFHSQLCAHHDDTSTHVHCSALFKTDFKASSHTCPLTLQFHSTWLRVERVSKLGEEQEFPTTLVSSSTSTIAQFKSNVISWCSDMQGQTQKCVQRYCEVANKNKKQVAQKCPQWESYLKFCTDVVFKWQYLARIGHPDI